MKRPWVIATGRNRTISSLQETPYAVFLIRESGDAPSWTRRVSE
jgi:hypothetical protein